VDELLCCSLIEARSCERFRIHRGEELRAIPNPGRRSSGSRACPVLSRASRGRGEAPRNLCRSRGGAQATSGGPCSPA
jgi:hypothetical protein